MKNVYPTATVNPDGSLTIPAFVVCGLGYPPGGEVRLALPEEMCGHACEDGELPIRRVCDEYGDGGYTAEGDAINIPLGLLKAAGLKAGSEISVLSSDGMLIIAATGDDSLRDLTDELGCFMAELGHDPESVETLEANVPF
jgi:antitoxin component of MazEF toxin-antitoxin module